MGLQICGAGHLGCHCAAGGCQACQNEHAAFASVDAGGQAAQAWKRKVRLAESPPIEAEEEGAPGRGPAGVPGATRRRRPAKRRVAKAVQRLVRLTNPGALAPGAQLADPLREDQGALLQELEAYAAEAVMAKLADGTRKGYDVGWRHWVQFRELQNKSPFLAGETRAEMRQDENDLLTYVGFLSKIMKRTPGTILQKLFAIKFAHTVAGLPDPLHQRFRLWAAISGFRRWQG